MSDAVDTEPFDSSRETFLSSVVSADRAYAAVGFRDRMPSGVDTDALIRISCDGDHWLPTDAPTEAGWLTEVAFGNHTLVAAGMHDSLEPDSGMLLMVRKLGEDWQSFVRTGDDRLWNLAFGNGVFLARNAHGLVRSSDGVSWEAVSLELPDLDRTSLSFDGDRFMTYSPDGFRLSEDGETWSEPRKSRTFEHCGGFVSSAGGFVGFCGDTYVPAGGDIQRSHVYALTGPRGSHPADAQVSEQDFNYTPSDVAISGTTLVAFAGLTPYATSLPFGSGSWQPPGPSLHDVPQLNDLTSGAGRFVAVGYGIVTSVDGETWTQHELR